jgi:2-isopropylmalate synthase
MKKKIVIFDTTLRDGEQSPGASMNVGEKLRMAKQLAKLKVDVIEAGFPASSEGDFESVKTIARSIRGPVIAGLARTGLKDIDRAWEAVKYAEKPAIHTFIATSDIHLKYKLNKSRKQVLEDTVRAVSHAKAYCPMVEFSAEDATRSDPDYLCQVFEAAIKAGATTINVPDTVGYSIPDEFASLIKYLRKNVAGIKGITISVHCHNDLGLAVANSIAAVKAGARQVECTINGIGERAGNASMEEVVMAINTRKDIFNLTTGINTRYIYPASRFLSQITGMVVQPNKAIVGANAFAHEAGIHQDGLLKERQTYEIMTPESIGLPAHTLIMGKHSGRHAFRERLKSLGYELSNDNMEKAFIRFKALADKKKEVYDEDLEAIIADEVLRIPERYKLVSINVTSGSETIPTATVQLEIEGKVVKEAGFGDGPVDAAYNTIAKITKTKSKLLRFSVNAITGGTDAQGEVTVNLEEGGKTAIGQGAHTDIIVASAKAYINALNKMEYRKKRKISGP